MVPGYKMASVENDVLDIGRQLEKLTYGKKEKRGVLVQCGLHPHVLSLTITLYCVELLDGDVDTDVQALDLLKALSKLKVNLTILTSTRIGMTVNALR